MLSKMMSVGLVLVLLATAAAAVPIEGMTLVAAVGADGSYAYFMDGDSENRIEAPAEFHYGRMCPTLDRVTYMLRDMANWPDIVSDVWVADIDGSNATNATYWLGAVNCMPAWSPDGTQVAFQRSIPTDELSPCEAGFEIWVVDADGSNPHRVSPLGLFTYEPSWAPDGYRIVCTTDDAGTHIVDSDGTDWQSLPGVAGQAKWSPDGSLIASTTYIPDVVGGEPGVWRNLWLTAAAGGNPVALRERFVSDSDIALYFEQDRPPEREGTDPYQSVRMQVGVNDPIWSPRGDQLIFREAMDFDPLGIGYQFQTELWLYDLGAQTFTRLTHNEDAETKVTWGGYNTTAEQLTVSVGTVTITFDTVLADGVTVVLRDDDPPDVAAGLYFAGYYYELRTTATVTGPIGICIGYTDAAVPPGVAEHSLAIMAWDDEEWVDVTVGRDSVQNTICAETTTLSALALLGAREARFADVPAWGYGDDGTEPSWAYYAVQSCADASVVGGYPDGSYQPQLVVDRAQMAVYIARALAGGEGSVPLYEGEPTFPDVDGEHWAFKYVEFVVEQRVVGGYPDGTYRPGNQVDRGQMAVYMARALVAPAGEAGVPEASGGQTFPDVAVDFWAFDHVSLCVEEGVVTGYGDGLYRPATLVTRDQMAVYVARALLW